MKSDKRFDESIMILNQLQNDIQILDLAGKSGLQLDRLEPNLLLAVKEPGLRIAGLEKTGRGINSKDFEMIESMRDLLDFLKKSMEIVE